MWETILNVDLICLIAGPVVAMLVSAFKKIAFVQNYPKIVAAILSTVVAIVSAFTFYGLDWAALATCILVPFVTAVATYEVVIKPLGRSIET